MDHINLHMNKKLNNNYGEIGTRDIERFVNRCEQKMQAYTKWEYVHNGTLQSSNET